MIEDTPMQHTHLSDASLDLPFTAIQIVVQVGAIDRRGIISAIAHNLILALLLLFLLLILKEAENCSCSS